MRLGFYQQLALGSAMAAAATAHIDARQHDASLAQAEQSAIKSYEDDFANALAENFVDAESDCSGSDCEKFGASFEGVAKLLAETEDCKMTNGAPPKKSMSETSTKGQAKAPNSSSSSSEGKSDEGSSSSESEEGAAPAPATKKLLLAQQQDRELFLVQLASSISQLDDNSLDIVTNLMAQTSSDENQEILAQIGVESNMAKLAEYADMIGSLDENELAQVEAYIEELSDAEPQFAEVYGDHDEMQLASTEAQTQISNTLDAYEDVTGFLSQLDRQSKDDFASRLLSFGEKAMNFYDGLNKVDQMRAHNMLAQVEEQGLDWAGHTSEDNKKELFSMLTQTGYGEHWISGERSAFTNHVIDFFKDQSFTQTNSAAQPTSSSQTFSDDEEDQEVF